MVICNVEIDSFYFVLIPSFDAKVCRMSTLTGTSMFTAYERR
jgi:hypothetical protein